MKAQMTFVCKMQAEFGYDRERVAALAAQGAPVQLSVTDASGEGFTVFLDYPENFESETICEFPYVNAAVEFATAFACQLEKHHPGLVVAVKPPMHPPEGTAWFRLDWLHLDF